MSSQKGSLIRLPVRNKYGSFYLGLNLTEGIAKNFDYFAISPLFYTLALLLYQNKISIQIEGKIEEFYPPMLLYKEDPVEESEDSTGGSGSTIGSGGSESRSFEDEEATRPVTGVNSKFEEFTKLRQESLV